MKRRVVLTVLVATCAAATDWRSDLLEAEGIGLAPEALRAAASGSGLDTARLEEAYRQLGSESFPERESAQRRIVTMGSAAIDWLKQRPGSDDPEVRLRVAAIRGVLEFESDDRHDRMVRHAAASLLAAAGKPADKATGGTFYEWFGLGGGPLGERYRRFHFEAADGMIGRIRDGALVFPGDRPGDGDQRLILKAVDWPGRPVFPDAFRVSTRLGGTPGGSGAWHLGVSIGRVRALYHPGMTGGAFRFERVEGNESLTGNAGMGFTPSTLAPQWMVVDVLRLPDGDVRLAVSVRQKDSPTYKTELDVPARMIGPLDRVSLDRSGRTGGDARFSDLLVETADP